MKKNNYTAGPIGKVKIVEDFLPTPDKLVFKEDNVKVTILLSKFSVDYFKTEAKRHHTKYQKMIRNLLDQYSMRHSQ